MLAHELSHVAHRDVLVMTVASSAGITAGMLAQGAQYGAFFGGGRRDNNNGGLPIWLVVLIVSLDHVRRQLRAAADPVALPRALGRPRRCAPDPEPGCPRLARCRRSPATISQIPQRDLRQVSAASALCIAPALKGSDIASLFSTHPPLEKRLEQLAKIQAELGRPTP